MQGNKGYKEIQKTYYLPKWFAKKYGISGFNNHEIISETNKAVKVHCEKDNKDMWIAKSILLDQEDK